MSLAWIPLESPGRLAVCPLPDDVELQRWGKAGAGLVVSLVGRDEAPSWSSERERLESEHHHLGFLSFPVPDFGVPEDEQAFERLARRLADELARGTGVVIHCKGGRGRSSLLAAGVLALGGLGLDESLERIRSARPEAGPETEEQAAWLEAFVGRLGDD